MPRITARPSEIMARLVEEGNIDFISPSQVQEAMVDIRRATTGLADDDNPKCLIACALDLRESGSSGHTPVECAEPATADNHSIQENGVLSSISRVEKDGTRKVLRFFPSVSRLANHTKGEAGYPGGEWIWNIKHIEPELVPISLASIGHFACGDHDGYTFGPVDQLALANWDSYVRIDERNCAAEHRDLAYRLSLLAYRTLLFRISQFRGTESVSVHLLDKVIRSGNRFGVDSLMENLSETASVMRSLYRHKSLFDRRVTELASEPLVHHIAPFSPTIRFAASEYLPIKLLQGRGRRHLETQLFASCNVYPDEERANLIVSHPASPDQSVETSVANYVRDFTCETPTLRRKQDLECLSRFTNVYASPEGYTSLMPEDKLAVETAIAWNVCEKPYERAIERLKQSPAGGKLIVRLQNEIASVAV